jgi:3-hydroxyisobutyrate dehydrogenase-like beta-hydroxyacid dehydrogenase
VAGAGFDIAAGKRKELSKAGVEIARDAKAVAAAAPIIITSLPKPEALIATAREIAKAKLPPRIIAECSTFNIEDKEKAEKILRAAGHVMLDCPVSGTGSQARTGDLVIYASGDPKSVAKVSRCSQASPARCTTSAPFGNGSKMKYVANLLVAINNVASAEAMVLGMKAGLDPSVIFEMISNGAGNSRVFELRAPMMVKNDYSDVTMKCSVWQKDMDVIGAFAKKDARADPAVLRDAPGLCRGAQKRPRRGRHRRGLRRAGGQGERQTPQDALTIGRVRALGPSAQ